MEHPENDEAYKGLKVNKGVENVPTVNPYLKRRVQRKQYTTSEFVEGILKGNITVLSHPISSWLKKSLRNVCLLQGNLYALA